MNSENTKEIYFLPKDWTSRVGLVALRESDLPVGHSGTVRLSASLKTGTQPAPGQVLRAYLAATQ
jgi:hypothetical protein